MHFNDIKAWSWRGARNIIALWFSGLHHRTPRLAKAIGLFIVVYAASPIDLTPELMPIPSYLDDLVMLAGLSWLALHMLPSNVWQECCVQSDRWLGIAARWLSRAWNGLLLVAALLGVVVWLWLWFGFGRA
ncbi:YkvA family protein [Variovorax sp. LjRoot178]|uniref:YkvA family protein n=1 Tax=Variovorax sp. LjRoot178 TaxID=3342277 RepID=UPI003ED10DA7